MPTPTYTPLANITLGSSAASVTFSSISQAYRDLVLVTNTKTVGNGSSYLMRVNGDTGANYSRVAAWGTGSATGSGSGSGSNFMFGNNGSATSSTEFELVTTNFMDYSATDKHKTTLTRSNLASGTYPGTEMIANRWANTAAITSIVIFGDTWQAGSTFALYGIAA